MKPQTMRMYQPTSRAVRIADQRDLSKTDSILTTDRNTDVKTAEANTQQDEISKNKEYVVQLKFKSKGTKGLGALHYRIEFFFKKEEKTECSQPP